MAVVPAGFADLKFLDWLADLDIFNNLWFLEEDGVEDDDAIDNDEEFFDAEEGELEGDEDEPEGDESDSDSDNGYVTDASDEEGEELVTSKHLPYVHPMYGLFCTTKTYVAVEVVGGQEYHLCLGCYLGYQSRVDDGRHRHVDYHATTPLTEGERGYCKSCKDPLFQIRRVDICNICNK